MPGTSAPTQRLAPCGRWDGSTLVLRVRVQTRARHAGLGEVENGEIRLRLHAPPVDGKANEEARRLLAEACGVPLSRVQLAGGDASRHKTFRIAEPVQLPAAVVAA